MCVCVHVCLCVHVCIRECVSMCVSESVCLGCAHRGIAACIRRPCRVPSRWRRHLLLRVHHRALHSQNSGAPQRLNNSSGKQWPLTLFMRRRGIIWDISSEPSTGNVLPCLSEGTQADRHGAPATAGRGRRRLCAQASEAGTHAHAEGIHPHGRTGMRSRWARCKGPWRSMGRRCTASTWRSRCG